MDGVPEALEAGGRLDVTVIPGVELSARVPSGSLHLLGYFSDSAPQPLAKRLVAFRTERVSRARTMVDRLADLGAPVSWEDVLARARGSVGRPHIADALVAAGHVATRADAFARYLADDGPAYIPSATLDPRQAIELVSSSGGAPVLAHPYSLRMGRETLRAFVSDLRDLGLRGIEVHRADHDAPDTAFLANLACDLDLVATGGSDFHRPDGAVELGDTGPAPIDAAVVARLATQPIR
jgi:3',5'-nucleoside bisphosphate phosphatase